jgi:hypothetical protein
MKIILVGNTFMGIGKHIICLETNHDSNLADYQTFKKYLPSTGFLSR